MSAKRNNSSALALAVFCALLAFAAPAHSQTNQPQKTWALVIGVSKYPRLPGGQQLQFADKDALSFAEALKKSGVAPERIRVLIGADATSSAIKSAIGNWLARSASEADAVYIFFSGHGFVERDFGESYFLGYDSDLNEPYGTAVSMSELRHALGQRVRSQQIMIIADAVRRDLFPPESEEASAFFVKSFGELATLRQGISAILASGPGEFSREGQRWGAHGVFTKHFLDGISGSADNNADGSITVEEVFAFLSARVSEDTSDKQHPWRTESSLSQAIISRARIAERAEPTRSSTPERSIEAPRSAPSAPIIGAALPPSTETVSPTRNAEQSVIRAGAGGIAIAELPPPPKVMNEPPAPATVSLQPPKVATQPGIAHVPVSQPGAVPSPLTLQLEAAINAGNLIEPKNSSAWDYYQQLNGDASAISDMARLRPKLVEALLKTGREIVTGDVRADNVSEKVEDFRKAGQIFMRARSLAPDSAEILALEKLSAAQALIALQFFDEAERALAPVRTARLAAVENALGLLHQGKLDFWQAERAFKRAIEIDPDWATPHYNLAVLYQSQKKEAALAEFEQAVALDSSQHVFLIALGDEHFKRQQWEMAAAAYRKAIALKPADDATHTKLGHALYSQGLRDEANREYQKASELRGKNP